MFYTKYRPQKFSEISTPNATGSALAKQVKDQTTVHAYLFVGSRGTGKTTTARILAKALNCEKLESDGDPCTECKNCVSIARGTFYDLIEIDAASNRGIDNIRDLKDKIKLAPSTGKAKVYIIDEVHMLTTEAFNALLKTLEEPPSHAVFILCTTEVHKVPETIKSRCQVYKFKKATVEQLVTRLKFICEQEGIKNVTDVNLEKIAKAAGGGFRDAENMLQQVVEGGLDPDSFAGLSSRTLYIDFVQDLLAKNALLAIKRVNKVLEDGLDLNVWTLELLEYLRDLLFISVDAYDGLVEGTKDELAHMEKQAKSTNQVVFARMIEAFSEAGNKINDSQIPQLPLELAIVRLCNGSASGASDGNPTLPGVPSAEDSIGFEPDVDEDNDDGFASQVEEADVQKRGTSNDVKVAAARTEIDENLLARVQNSWQEVIKASEKHNNSIRALLKSCTPAKVDGHALVLEVMYKFHKDRLETPKNLKIIEISFEEVFGFVPILKCRVNSENRPAPRSVEDYDTREVGVLTDKNVAPADTASAGNILDFFDGALPLSA